MIAEAVLEVGISNATMKSVAEHIGMSVPGLYHHVRNRRDLLLLAGDYSMSKMRLPNDRGQHWSEWLREWARYTRKAFLDEPQVFTQFMSGALKPVQMVDVIDNVQTILSRQGFTPLEAVTAWSTVSECALGSVVTTLRERTTSEAGHATLDEFSRLLADRPDDELTGLRSLAGQKSTTSEDFFEDELTTVLVGIAARRDEPWSDIVSGGRGKSSP